ncbi:c-type cytochrome biogenesis protein CcmI [Hyphococcus formosus]|uniref:c-type cytochrome biogenesis protein CcmI n=1 Tax=Hyphococcus formosus TaxID=3143534 RepID=UPI00398BB62D
MIWFVFILLCAIIIAFLVEPFFRGSQQSDNLDEQDYLTAQLDDIERDKSAGLIDEAEADAARLDARRRLLAAARGDKGETGGKPNRTVAQISTMIIAAAPIAALAIYMAIGNPDGETSQEATMIAARSQQQSDQNAPPLAESITALEERVASNPENLDDWILLAESYARMDRFSAAAQAFGKARALAPERAFLHAAEGEAITMAAGGVVSVDAQAAFDRALAIDPAEPRARFYKALGTYQQDDPKSTLDQLVRLAGEAPSGAPWLTIVRSQIDLIANELGIDPESLGLGAKEDTGVSVLSRESSFDDWVNAIEARLAEGDITGAKGIIADARERYAQAPFVLQQLDAIEAGLADGAPRRGPSQEQMAAAQNMSAEDREAMIEGMVSGLASRLEQNPDDIEGWTMLARSYAVLGRYRDSADAYANAIKLAPEDVALSLGRAEALLTVLRSENKPIDAETKAAIDKVSELSPEHPFALYFQGLAASQSGDKARARSYWERLLATMPADAPEAASVRSMIESL